MIRFTVTNDADQKFSTIVNNRRVTIRLWYANFNDRWSADISIDGEPVLHGRKIVTGVDLLGTFDFGIGVIFAHSAMGENANRNNLPDGIVRIYHTTREEINAAISA